jgi:hypothetical protein
VLFRSIKNTLQLSEIMISESLLAEARTFENITILSDPFDLQFDDQGNLRRE